VNLGFHAVAQDGIDHLMAGNGPLTFKGSAHDDSLEVMAIPLDREMLTA
jgi:hypothetical protein